MLYLGDESEGRELGMKSTHFNNPHGLPSAGHQTTARDLARLAFVAFQVPEFKKVVGTPRARIYA